jgi:hypothetical protein
VCTTFIELSTGNIHLQVSTTTTTTIIIIIIIKGNNIMKIMTIKIKRKTTIIMKRPLYS